MVNTDAEYITSFRARMNTLPDPVANAHKRWWAEKEIVLHEVRERVRRELEKMPDFSMSTYGQAFAPVVDLVCRIEPGYGWIPAGLADRGISFERRLTRGTSMRFDHGEQEQCPGGPGENLLWFKIGPSSGSAVSGWVIVPYDLRFDFGANLGDVLLAGADDPVFNDAALLDALALDIRAIIERAPSTVWTPPTTSALRRE